MAQRKESPGWGRTKADEADATRYFAQMIVRLHGFASADEVEALSDAELREVVEQLPESRNARLCLDRLDEVVSDPYRRM